MQLEEKVLPLKRTGRRRLKSSSSRVIVIDEITPEREDIPVANIKRRRQLKKVDTIISNWFTFTYSMFYYLIIYRQDRMRI